MKLCNTCKINKEISCFGKRKDTLSPSCKKCVNARIKRWQNKHQSQVKQYKQKYLDAHQEQRRAYEKQYYLDHKEEFYQRSQTLRMKLIKHKYHQKQRLNPMFRLRENVSRAINRALHRQNSKKDHSIFKYLNYSLHDLQLHLQNQFIGEMTWNNYGSCWHLDHIIPQSDLPYISMTDPNFQICWALNNLRPLFAAKNYSDGGSKIRHRLRIKRHRFNKNSKLNANNTI